MSPTLDVATDRDLYLEGGHNKVYVEARIRTPSPANATSPATNNLAFVLDRSGGMAGAPIQALRQALSLALNSLADSDVVSVVLFGSEVETLVEARRHDQLGDPDKILAQIEPAGGAALYDALNQGAAQLRRYAGPGTINHLVLVTSGRPTKGPRELDDFSRLAGLFAQEGITLSTIGVGPDFNEDLLAALARAGNGHFHYADRPEKLAEALQSEAAPQRALIARDAVLTFEFDRECTEMESYGWSPATIKDETVSLHFPYLFAGQDLSVLASAVMPARFIRFKFVTVRLTWKGTDDQVKEIVKPVMVILERNGTAVRNSANPAVVQATVSALISEGMQNAIEQIDKGNFRRAIKELRSAHEDAVSMNDDPSDPVLAAKIKRLEAYLAEVQARGMNQLDRKILRSGLFNQFESPTADDHPDK